MTERMSASTPLPPDYYRAIHEVEELHWWHVGMRELSAAILGARLDVDGLRVLDAGCGTGGYLAWLRQRRPDAQLTGFDVSAEAVSLARERVPSADVFVASAGTVELAPAAFDVIILNDVLQHVAEESVGTALAALHRALAPGGALLVRTNGARRARRDAPDWRVYDRAELVAELRAASFDVVRATYANALLSVWGALRGRAPRIPSASGHGIPRPAGRLSDAVGSRLLRAEAEMLRRGRSVPYGHTLFALATPVQGASTIRSPVAAER